MFNDKPVPILVLLAAAIAVGGCLPALADSPETALLQQRAEQLLAGGELVVGEARIAAVRMIPRLYERRAFKLAWTRPAMVEQLLVAVRGSYDHGLDPRDYHLGELEKRLAAGDWRRGELEAGVDLDLLLTDSLVRLAFTLHFGKLDPAKLDQVWNFSRELELEDPVQVLAEVLETGDVQGFLDGVAPSGFFYKGLRSALAAYRSIAQRGGWSAVPDGPVLKPGMDDPRVPALRERLMMSGDLESGEAGDPDLYDETLEQAILRFQGRHGIDPDGKVGPQTLEELNVPVSRRVDQIRASLERARWVFRDIESDFLVVDIAGFKLHLVRGGEEVWTTRVQVGKPYRETPVFRSGMRYLVINPTWTVPPGILSRDVLPRVRKETRVPRTTEHERSDV